ncbi:MAG TPA: N-acetyltransferase DgcN [Pseudoxanthomonas sp.]
MKSPYLLFLGDVTELAAAKTAAGILQWRPALCVGQTRAQGGTIDLGLPEMSPEQAAAAGAQTMVLGIANAGGFIPESWLPVMHAALEAGLDLAAGMHQRMDELPSIRDAARRLGRTLHDVRQPTQSFAPGNGKKRSGKRLLTVGTDCAVGKKYTALAIEKALLERGANAEFRATGQTGIFISGRGVAVDSVVADFISGAAEWLSPENSADHWDIIEGQGSLLHPAYAGVTLGLTHGSQPDALVICHEPMRTHMVGFGHYPVPDLYTCLQANLAAARLTNPNVVAAGISVNTSRMQQEDIDRVIGEMELKFGLPCCDPVRHGAGKIADYLLSYWN